MYFKLLNALLLLSILAACSCGPSRKHYINLETMLAHSEFDQASVYLQKNKSSAYDKKEAMLYYLDQGTADYLAGKHKESNDSFNKAEIINDELFTKSISRAILAYTVNDAQLEYEGEAFENGLINFFSAMNYLNMDKYEDALVEMKKVSHKLQVHLDKYVEELDKVKQAREKPSIKYLDDAFIQYLVGKLYEMDKDDDDALIAYRKSFEIYHNIYSQFFETTIPEYVVEDYYRLAIKLNFQNDIAKIKRLLPQYASVKNKNENDGEVIIVHLNGMAPFKESFELDLPINSNTLAEVIVGAIAGLVIRGNPKGMIEGIVVSILIMHPEWAFKLYARGMSQMNQISNESAEAVAGVAGAIGMLNPDAIRVSLPVYFQRKPAVTHSNILIDGNYAGQSILAENISKIAVQNLNDYYMRYVTRALGRVIFKKITEKLAEKTSAALTKNKDLGKLVGFATSLIGKAVEEADRRCWRILPSEIRMSRLYVPEGERNIKITFNDSKYPPVEKKIKVERNKTQFITVNTY